jgi:polysaccharide biosynthesis transport protein
MNIKSGPFAGTDTYRPSRASGVADQIDLKTLLRNLWHAKVWIIACMIVVAFAGARIGSDLAPSYTATARVLIGSERLNVTNFEQVVVSRELQGEDNIENYVEIARSRALLERVVDELGLVESAPQAEGDGQSIGDRLGALVATLFPSRNAGEADGPPGAEAATAVETAEERRSAMAAQLANNLRVRPVQRSRVMEISFSSNDPELSARVANAVAQAFIDHQLEAQLEAARGASEWLAEQADELRAQVQEAENLVQQVRAEMLQGAGEGAQVTADQLQVFVRALTEVRSNKSKLDVRLQVLTEALEEGRDFGAIGEFRASPIIERYRDRLAELRDQEVALRAVRAADVEARVLDARIADLNSSIELEAMRIVDGLTAERDALAQEESVLLREIASLRRVGLEQAREELRLRELEREAEASRRLYESVFSRLSEIRLQESLQIQGTRMLASADIPKVSGTPSSSRLALFGTVAGLGLGIVLVSLRDVFRSRFASVQELEAETGYPVIGVLPRVRWRPSLASLAESVKRDPLSTIAEAARHLRTSIQTSASASPPRVIMVTSGIPSEGKSATALLLALTSKQAGKSTILVDCDLRRPAFRSVFPNTRRSLGLVSILTGRNTVEAATLRDPDTGLDVIPAGSLGGAINAADLLSSPALYRLISELREKYDVILIDTPPVLAVSDARIVAPLVDSIILAVRYGSTHKNAAKQALLELEAGGASVQGIVATFVSQSAARRNDAGRLTYSLKYQY